MIAFARPSLPPRPLSAQRTNGSIGPVTAPLRFTLDGSDELEGFLADICKTVMAGLRGLIPPDRLQAVLLGGGYGRGEGGVMGTPEGDRPYNDLEFYVCLRGNRHLNEWRHRLPLEVLGEILTPMAGVEIEFKIISLAELRKSRISMFSYDLLMGHRWLAGHGGLLLGFAHHRIADRIPLSEAIRLLMNRCSGLLFADERLKRDEFTAADADFVERNIAKAELAFGDAVLAAHGQYRWSCEERHRRLMRLSPAFPPQWLNEVRASHAAGLKFKLRPHRSAEARAALRERHAAAVSLGLRVWLWLEEQRLGSPFATARDYAESPVNKCPETSRLRNLLVNLKTFGVRSLFSLNPFRHPRDRALRALSLLLWDPAAGSGTAQKDLSSPPCSASPPRGLVASYRTLWRSVN